MTHTNLKAVEAVTDVVNDGKVKYFFADVTACGTGDIEFRLHCASGDGNMFISESNGKPSITSCSWKNISLEKEKCVLISEGEAASLKIVYIAISAYKSNCNFELSMTRKEPPARSSPTIVHVGVPMGAAPTEPMTKCATCGVDVPTRTHVMHSAYCARNNWKCPQCGVIMSSKSKDSHIHCPICNQVVDSLEKHSHCTTCNAIIHPAEREKHNDLVHTAIKCSCGVFVDPKDFEIHKSDICKFRLVKCKYCEIMVPNVELYNHENYCGGRTVSCTTCGKDVVLRKMDIHLAAEHGVNPSKLSKSDFANLVKNNRSSMGTGPPPVTPLVETSSEEELRRAIEMSLNGLSLSLYLSLISLALPLTHFTSLLSTLS